MLSYFMATDWFKKKKKKETKTIEVCIFENLSLTKINKQNLNSNTRSAHFQHKIISMIR